MSKQFRLSPQGALASFKKLSADFELFAPVEKKNGGRFSDADIITYDGISAFDQIKFFKKTFFSAKEAVFPLRETLFQYAPDEINEAKTKIKRTIVFLRSCDIHALKVTDIQFLRDGGVEDNYYRRRRKKLAVFLIECEKPFANCYCVSLGTNRTEAFDVFLRPIKTGYAVKINNPEFEKYFSGTKTRVEPRFVKKDVQPVAIPEKIDLSLFEADLWKESARRCIACGRCNFSCPTCTCFTVQQGCRIWSACQVKKFSLLAGQHDFRTDHADRLRYRTLHKVSDFKARNGVQMCVGCGRCDDVCPVYISMFKCIDQIHRLKKGRKK